MNVIPSALRQPFPDTPRGQTWFRIGHYSMFLIMGWAVGDLAWNWIPASYSTVWDSVNNVFLIAAVYLMIRHDFQLCERCITAMPLDGERRAGTWWRRLPLRAGHYANQSVTGARVVLGVIVAVFAGTLLIPDHPFWVKALSWEVSPLTILAFYSARYTHGRLQPWCPWCRDDGGGGFHEPSPQLPADRLPVA